MSRPAVAVALLLLPAALCSGTVRAQQSPAKTAPQDPFQGEQTGPKKKALEAFHGPDLRGKDGPMAKAGLDLALLYFRYRADQEKRGGEFDPGNSYQLMENGRVVVDAIARPESTRALRRELGRLGGQDLATVGRIVSGGLPIDRIPEAAALSALRGLRPSVAKTQSGISQQPDLIQSRSEGDGESSGLLGGMLVLLVVLLLTELR